MEQLPRLSKMRVVPSRDIHVGRNEVGRSDRKLWGLALGMMDGNQPGKGRDV